MNWSSFSAGVVFGVSLLLALYLTLPPIQKEWRQCAPAQDGEALVSTTQLVDRTECTYTKKPTGRVAQRKKTTS